MNNYIVRIRFVSVQSCCILSNFRITCKNDIHYNDNVMNDVVMYELIYMIIDITLIRTLQMISCRSNVYRECAFNAQCIETIYILVHV